MTDIEFDDQGRFVFPEYLRVHAGIVEESELVFVWQNEYIEIWNKRNWDMRQKDILRNIGAIAQATSEDGT